MSVLAIRDSKAMERCVMTSMNVTTKEAMMATIVAKILFVSTLWALMNANVLMVLNAETNIGALVSLVLKLYVLFEILIKNALDILIYLFNFKINSFRKIQTLALNNYRFL